MGSWAMGRRCKDVSRTGRPQYGVGCKAGNKRWRARGSSLYKKRCKEGYKKSKGGISVLMGESGSILSLECGFYHNQAIKSDGVVIAWGRNEFGQLGDGTTTDSSGLVQVENLNLSLDTPPPAVSPECSVESDQRDEPDGSRHGGGGRNGWCYNRHGGRLTATQR